MSWSEGIRLRLRDRWRCRAIRDACGTQPRPIPAAGRRAPSRSVAREQELEEALLRHRRRDQRALAEVAAHRHQRLQVGLALDALGDRRAAETMREIDAVWQIAALVGVGRAVVHEAVVELELGEGQLAQARERGIAGAEIIDRDLDAAVAASWWRSRCARLEIAHDLVLGHLQDDAGPAIGFAGDAPRPAPGSAA